LVLEEGTEQARPTVAPVAELADALRVHPALTQKLQGAESGRAAGAEEGQDQPDPMLEEGPPLLSLAQAGHLARLADEDAGRWGLFNPAQTITGRGRRVTRPGTGQQIRSGSAKEGPIPQRRGFVRTNVEDAMHATLLEAKESQGGEQPSRGSAETQFRVAGVSLPDFQHGAAQIGQFRD